MLQEKVTYMTDSMQLSLKHQQESAVQVENEYNKL